MAPHSGVADVQEVVRRRPAPTVADPGDRPRKGSAAGDVLQIVRSSLRLLLWIGAIWAMLYSVHSSLPFIRPGHEVVYQRKVEIVNRELVFPPVARQRVVVFGNSKVLSGFVPNVFDALAPEQTSSYNLGLPDATHFLPELEALIRRGQTPTHVLLTSPWNPRSAAARMSFPRDDGLVTWMFPFRRLPRNAALFLMRSARRGGPAEYYFAAERVVTEMERARGYFFIEGQSHFPDHRLPDGFRLSSDQPAAVRTRQAVPEGHDFQEMLALAARHGIQFLLVPTYYRQGESALPPPENRQLSEILRPFPAIHAVGPDYILLPNECFSDPVHLNPEGARRYTEVLAALCRPLWERGTEPVAGDD